MTKERPILFSGPMVRAILEDSKTQTRRAVKPLCGCPDFYAFKEGDPYPHYFRRKDAVWDSFKSMEDLAAKYSPYGKVGDRLWVRETWREYCQSYFYRATDLGDMPDSLLQFENPVRWKPSIFMPRKASRILLEISKVRLEPLNAISETDAIAEGFKKLPNGRATLDPELYQSEVSAKVGFSKLWNAINGKKFPWDSNHLVWVYDFCRVKGGSNHD